MIHFLMIMALFKRLETYLCHIKYLDINLETLDILKRKNKILCILFSQKRAKLKLRKSDIYNHNILNYNNIKETVLKIILSKLKL